ncbi:Crp/Fnr family transcriptional regulator [Pedobacter sp. AW31-3R]|uniref:Crp/Fnr family transcriptional regulator n=1 Tax=Pedobacter sp. AW31-3R TaxID=3445781 RepID=UPI003FA02D0E
MFEEFKTYIKENTKLNDQEVQLMLETAVNRTLRKNEVLLHQGEICRYKTFVTKGLLRGYRLKEDGSEHMIWFSTKDWWILDPDSYHSKTPSNYIIDAIEESDVIVWSKENFDQLMISIPGLKTFSDLLVNKNASMTRERVFRALSATPEEKYEDFIKTYPDIFPRLPLHLVASYLGVSRKTITRIRHAQLKR